MVDALIGYHVADMDHGFNALAKLDEGSELGHVGYYAFKRHPLVQIADLLHVVAKTGREKLVARIGRLIN